MPGGVAITVRGLSHTYATPAAGRFRATIAFRDPATAEDANQCRGVTQAFRAIGKKGALRFP